MEVLRDPDLKLRDYNQKLIELLKENQKKTLPTHPKTVISTTAPIIQKKNSRNKNGFNKSQPRESSQTARKKLAKSKSEPCSNLCEDKSGKYSSYKQADSSSCIGSRPTARKPIAQGIEYVESELPPTFSRPNTEIKEISSESGGDDQQTGRSQEDERYAEYESYEAHLENELEHIRSVLDEGRDSIANKSSTPVGTPNVTPQGTPKSILRHRKLIDDNIQVRSKYPHTPVHQFTRQGGVVGLNYSYSDVDDDDFDHELEKDLHTDLNGSYTEELESKQKVPNNTPTDSSHAVKKQGTAVTSKQPVKPPALNVTPKQNKATSYKRPTSKKSPQVKRTIKPTIKRPQKATRSGRILTNEARQQQEKQLSDVEALQKKNRLKNAGNDRKNAHIVRDLAQRPKAVLFDLEAPEADDQSVHSVTMNSQSNVTQSSRNQSMNSTRSSVRAAWQEGKEKKPLLGYDWIAGLLDNERSVIDEPDDYFKELSEFRKRNKYDCVGKEKMLLNGTLPAPITPVVQDPKHTCIHGYTVCERLFTQPMNVDEAGRSVCPICMVDRKEPTTVDPGYVRVSIPRSTIAEPYRVMPHRRRSFDPSDSYALTNHCLQGWQTAKPSTIPTASTVDIKQGTKDREILSYDEVQKLADSMSKMGRLMNSTAASQDASVHLNFNTNFSSNATGVSTATKDLLNNSHAIRAELQYLDRHAGIYRAAGPSSTNYPSLSR